MSHPRRVDQAIARFDEVMGRIDRGGRLARRTTPGDVARSSTALSPAAPPISAWRSPP